MGMNRRTNEEWLELYNRQRASGMTVKDWCAENHIKLPTMADRITHLRKIGLIKEAKPPRGKKSVINKSKEMREQNKKQKIDWMPINITEVSKVTGANVRLPLSSEVAERAEIQIKDFIIRVNMPLEDIIRTVTRCVL